MGVLFFVLHPIQSWAGALELSGTFSFSQSSYGENNFNWTRRLAGSIGYFFLDSSEVQVSIQNVVYRTKIEFIEDTTYNDQVYSVDWIQLLTSRQAFLQPFFRVGIGQLNRTASGTYWSGGTPPAILDSVTGVLGGGLRFRVFKGFAIKIEGVSYLPGAMLSTWRNNVSLNAGFSLYL